MSDLKVYYGACHKLFGWSLNTQLFGSNVLSSTNTNPYHFWYGLGSGYYKYVPFFLILFAPLSLVPWSYLVILFPVLSLACLYFVVHLFKKIIINQLKLTTENELKVLDISFLLVLILQSHNIYREILLGNINNFIMLFLALFLWFLSQKKHFFSALFLSLLILIKPHFIFIAPLLLFFRKYTLIFYGILISILCFALPLPFFGFSQTSHLLHAWLHAMQNHNNVDGYIENPMNIQYLFWNFCSALSIDLTKASFARYIPGTVVVFPFCLYLFVFLKRNIVTSSDQYFSIFVFALSGFIPFIMLVDTNQLFYVFPFMAYLFYRFLMNQCLYKEERRIRLSLILFCVAYVFTILTQQIPSDFLPLGKALGAGYLSVLIISFWKRNTRIQPSPSDLVL